MKTKINIYLTVATFAVTFGLSDVKALPDRPTQIGSPSTLGGGRLTTIAVDTLNQPHIVADGGSWVYVYDKIGGQWRNSSVDLGTIGYTQFYNPQLEIDADNRAWCSGVVFGADIGMAMFVRENVAVNPATPLDGFSHQNVTPNSWGVGELSLDPKDPGHVYLSGSVGWYSRFVYDPNSYGKVRRLESNMRVYAGNGGEKNAFWIAKNTEGDQIIHVGSNGYAREDSAYRNSKMGSSAYWAAYSIFPEMGDDGAYLDVKSDSVNPQIGYIASSFNSVGVYMNIWNGSKLLFDKSAPLLIDASGVSGLRRFAPQLYPANNGGVYITYTRNERVMLQYVTATGQRPWGDPVEIGGGGRSSICVDSQGDIHLAYTEGGQTKYRKIEIDGDSGTEGLFDAIPLQDDWYYSEWFGYFKDEGDNWINHSEHGRMLVSTQSGSDIWLYMNPFGWVRTSKSLYPNFYSNADGDWIRYLTDTSNPRWFYREAYDMWTTDQQSLARIATDKTTLSQTSVQGYNPKQMSFRVTNSGDGLLSYRVSRSVGWITLNPAEGDLAAGESDSINVGFDTAGLAPGQYSGTVTAWGPDAQGSPIDIEVSLTVKSIPELFNAESLGNGWYRSDWFGTFLVGNNGWIHHNGLGWMRVDYTSSTPDRIWLWDAKLGWLRTNASLYSNSGQDPSQAFFYSVTDGDWIAYAKNSDPRSFYRFKYGMTITDDQELAEVSVDKTAIQATCVTGFNAKDEVLTVSNSGAGTLSYRVDFNAPWIASVTPNRGESNGEDDQIVVAFNTDYLTEPQQGGTISVWAPGALVLLREIDVSLGFVKAPALRVDTNALSQQLLAGASAADQSFHVSNAGYDTLNYRVEDNADWLSLSDTNGTCTTETDTISVRYDSESLAPGIYTGTITVSAIGSDAFGSPQNIEVQLEVQDLFVSPTVIEAIYNPGSTPPESDLLSIQNRGPGTLYYELDVSYDSATSAWIELDAYRGSSIGEVDRRTISYLTDGLGLGEHTATITVRETDSEGNIIAGQLEGEINIRIQVLP